MRLVFSFIVLFVVSCSGNQKTSHSSSIENETAEKVISSHIQSLLDSSDVLGSILVYDLQNETYTSNNFDWANKGHLPASTFKIANTIIGLETGVIENDSFIFRWDGEEKWISSWEQDLVLRDAFHFSCVPCYQELAREIGVDRMKTQLKKLSYGHIVVDTNTIDNFWLGGESRISQMEQISFLKRLYESRLPISKRTEIIMRNLMLIKQNNNTSLSGKTGLSIENDHYNGWFVGFYEVGERTLFFATNIEPVDQLDRSGFSEKRKELTMTVLSRLSSFDFN